MKLSRHLLALSCLATSFYTKGTVAAPYNTSIKYSTWMLESIIARGEGVEAADGLLSEIQKGIFQEALRAAIASSTDADEVERWSIYRDRSVNEGLSDFANATADALVPLDRLCAGRSVIQSNQTSATALDVLAALRQSVDLQPRNSNGGLWYFAAPPPPAIPLRNISYLDGMYGFAPFASAYGQRYKDGSLNIESAFQQFILLYQHTLRNDTGLVAHGYDNSRSAPWADPVTGASPIVWGRSLAWYITGLVDAIATAENSSGTGDMQACRRMQNLFRKLTFAVIQATQKSVNQTGRYGVWQIVDQPGETSNFVEASASAMIVFALSKGLRLGYLGSKEGWGCDTVSPKPERSWACQDEDEMRSVLRAMYQDITESFVVRNEDGNLDYLGTSAICTLFQNSPYYEYYVSRPTVNNSLIGESAFVLASLEIEQML